jgi:hypothetical protein
VRQFFTVAVAAIASRLTRARRRSSGGGNLRAGPAVELPVHGRALAAIVLTSYLAAGCGKTLIAAGGVIGFAGAARWRS